MKAKLQRNDGNIMYGRQLPANFASASRQYTAKPPAVCEDARRKNIQILKMTALLKKLNNSTRH